MKQVLFFSFFVVYFLSSCKGETEKTQENSTSKSNITNRVEVIDFYGTHRCVTCKAIEASAKHTIETYFSNEPRVIFKTVNVADDANSKIAESFEATGTALFLNVIKNGKETHIDLTDFGFSKGREQEAFSKELKAKIEIELDKL